MNLCPNCASEIIPGSKFCNRCGDKIAERTKECPACSHKGPLSSVFCHHCGFHFDGKHPADKHRYQPVYPLEFDSVTLTEQVKALFFNTLRNRIELEHDTQKYGDYVERFYQSRFRDIYGLRSEQIAEDIMMQWERFGNEALMEIDKRLHTAFEGLLDFFIIQYCPDLNGILLPSAILKYEKVIPGKTDLWLMIRDFLDFDHEDEVFYFDFITMKPELLANACKSFLSAERQERVYFICDLSVKSNCKEGFAMTSKGIYWKSAFEKARKVMYKDIGTIQKQKDWLTINGHFFTANDSLNLKLCKLLKKLRGWQTAEPIRETVRLSSV
ncbi:MAG: zinc ribbon domain-containing protein [Lewinellaceae bacterium]|nr:zinc ribbon domain-containing protein [Saprospiraceae bacterium]MCB9345234.1 zinc ribbon domain-containing protein [Lewinellaceae bacterium]